MPQIEVADLLQDAVLIPAVMSNGIVAVSRYGEIKVGPPVAVRVRWKTVHEEKLDDKGNTVKIEARVVVDQEITPGSKLWLGSIDDYSGTGGDSVELMEVVDCRNTPDIKNRSTRRTCDLKRFRGVLPQNYG